METKTAVTALAALAQETRLAIFRLLVQHGPSGMAAGEIGAELGLAPATLSFHLKELSHAGLAVARPEGRYVFYSADFARMNDLVGYLTENCCARDGSSCGPGMVCAPGKPAASPRKAAPKRKGVKS
ncbi:MAG TPA: metalloregulator ArsR/SmtB family transcription factor [Burkholderiales bacterium]|jgi:DNA-binding transcriptional ArsR family regulator